MLKKEKTISNPSYSSLSAWGVLGVSTLAFLSLSYIPFPYPLKVLLLFIGIGIPPIHVFQCAKADKKGRKADARQEFWEPIPGWVWILLGLAAVLTRFWNISSLFLWPTGDEGLIGDGALQLSQKWNGRFFYTVGQNPPAFVWLCGAFFKYFRPATFDLWAPAALVSLLTVFMGILTARRLFSKSFSLVFGFLLVFGYWPLYLGRRCLPAVTVPLAELILLYCLIRFFQAKASQKSHWAFLTGACVGLQSLTYVAWPVVALAGAMAFCCGLIFHPIRKIPALTLFTSGALLGLLPFILGVYHEGYGQHVSNLSPWSGWFRNGGLFSNVELYIQALFWDVSDPTATSIRGQGGLLNPLTASFFFMGLATLYRSRREIFYPCGALTLVFFLLPGFLSLNLQTFRIVQAMPLLGWVAALGFMTFIQAVRGTAGRSILAGFLVFFAVWDFERIGAPYRAVENNAPLFLSTGKSLPRFRAFEALKEKEKTEGPGIVMGEWDVPADRTLEVTTYFFNAALNPGLDPAKVSWAGLVTDAHYRPFLQKRFPRAWFKELDQDLSPEGSRLLVLFEITPQDRETFARWATADRAFRDLNWGIDHIYDKDCLEKVEGKIRDDYPLVQGDPFLESVFWEKTAYFYYYFSGHYPEHMKALQLAVARGYPAAHLYYQLAGLYQVKGQTLLAKEAFQKAQSSERNFPWRGLTDVRKE